MLYEQFVGQEMPYRPAFTEDSYDEINAELQMLASIEDEVKEKRIYIGSGEDISRLWIEEAAANKGVILYG